MDQLWRDIRYGVRTLRRTPAFTLVVLLTLALGIGANTAIFSLTDQVLLRLLPVKQPDRLVQFAWKGPFMGRVEGDNRFSYPMYRDLRDHNQVLSGALADYPTSLTLSAGGTAERIDGALVSGNYFDVLGVQPAIGRLFSVSDEGAPGASPIVVLSYGYWMRRFAGNPAVLNQTIRLNDHPMTIVGVAAPAFYGLNFANPSDVFVPLTMKAAMTPTYDGLQDQRYAWLIVLGRLTPGVSTTRAEAGLNVLFRQRNEQELKEMPVAVSDRFRRDFVSKHLSLLPGGRGVSGLRRQFSTPILVLMGMVGLVLLIACANVANLLLARGAARQKEVAVRLALGAGRGTIVRQRLIESLLLACGGGALGLLLAWWSGGLLLNVLPFEGASRSLSADPDLRTMLFALAASVATALLFGLAPALQSTRPQLAPTLKDETGTLAGGTGHARFRKGLVVAQVGLSVLLLVGAGLFARSLYNLQRLNPGFEADRLIGFSLDPTLSGYTTERTIALYQQLQQDVAALPGVRSVSVSEQPILADSQWMRTTRVEGYQAKQGEDMNPDYDNVGPHYFATMGIPLVLGRTFTDRDVAGAPKVAVVNEAFARYFFGDRSPIGWHIGWGRGNTLDIEIVGVVKDSKTVTLRDKIDRTVYTPYTQASADDVGQMTVYVRAAGDPLALAASLRAAVRRIDPNLPVFDMKTMTAQVSESLFAERMVAALSLIFGFLATLLAAIGLYGVMSYSVARRTREIGIRMALGAERGAVLWLVLREVAMLVLLGVALGLPVAVALSRLVQSQLFGLSAGDPLTMAGAALLLSLVAMAAGYLPARRATTIDPMLALRYE
ncbi:MAG: ABC transporter permease [Acidobacteriota bacterium]|nr:ABC transporter permease [Acidobacteriota bacterium]